MTRKTGASGCPSEFHSFTDYINVNTIETSTDNYVENNMVTLGSRISEHEEVEEGVRRSSQLLQTQHGKKPF
jgi:hypothetical protein